MKLTVIKSLLKLSGRRGVRSLEGRRLLKEVEID
jgi:hypothetical protein